LAPSSPRSALAALDRLREGNRRFATGARRAVIAEPGRDPNEGQQPFAVILGCSDSRVPVEIIFDQGPGDLFVIRVAGNIVAPSQIGSVEFAADRFQSRLVVVMGHEHCGAVEATVDHLLSPHDDIHSRNQKAIVDRIKPAVEGVMTTELKRDRDALVDQAVRANVRMSAAALRHGSDVLERLIDTEGVLVVGAEYSITTGVVDFFDGT
jgi:carbonic anhydrase